VQDELASRRLARRWPTLVVFTAVAIMAMVLIQCGRGGLETVGDSATPQATPATTPATTSTPSTQAPTTPPTEPPTTTTTVSFPPAPLDMADPDEPGIIFEHNSIDIADASIFWDGNAGLYRLYATNDASADGSEYRNVPMWTSPNLRDWTLAGDVLPRIPAWAQAGHTWAPEIRHFGFIWVLYSTITDAASGLQCIAYSMSLVPEGPFTPDDTGPMICQVDRHGSIDASIFTDFDGSNWILWKSEENTAPNALGPTHLYSQRVDERGVPVGPENLLLTADQPWQDGLIESPSMAWGAMRYWLFVSGGSNATERYSVAATTCAGPAGPCEPATDDKVLIKTNKQGKGPGEQGVAFDNTGNLWLAYNPSAPFLKEGIRPLALAHVKFAWFGPYVAKPPESYWK
jgi:hypothetical protein